MDDVCISELGWTDRWMNDNSKWEVQGSGMFDQWLHIWIDR